MVSATRTSSARTLINVARFSYNRIGANPQATSGLVERRPTASTCRRTSRSARGPRQHRDHRLLQPRRRAAAVRRAAERGARSSPTTSPGCAASTRSSSASTSAREHMFIAFVNRPNGDFTFTGDRRRCGPATPRPTSCSGCRRSSGGRRRTRRRTATAGSTPATCRTSSGRGPNVTLNAGRALRGVGAVRRRERRAQLVPSRPAVDALPAGAARAGVSGRRRACPRGTYETDKNNFAPRLGVVVGSDRHRPIEPARGVGHLLRRARRPGRLLPERRARAAVHAAPRGQRAAGGADAAAIR